MRCLSLRGQGKRALNRLGFIAAGAYLALARGAIAADAAKNVAAAPDAAGQQVTNSTDLVRLVQSSVSQNHLLLWIGYLGVASIVSTGIYRFAKSSSGKSLGKRLESEVLTNWRLAMLGITSLALTLASGWTTWDGMTNFTGTPVLSFLITLGIQGIMLIAAWLIGESFAVGLANAGNGNRASMPDRILAVLSVGLLAIGLYFVSMASLQRGTIEFIDSMVSRHKSELALPIPTTNFRILISLAFSALLTALLVTQKEIYEPYLRGIKAILKTLPIWFMFLACAITSVFFSFDSLFSTIFPAQERERAAQLRTTNQVAGIVGDLGSTITKRQGAGIDALFSSSEWKDYSDRITDIITIARAAPDQIAELARKELEDQQSVRAGLQERKASASSQQAGINKRKAELLGDVGKLKEEVPPVAAEVDRLKGEVFKEESEILAKKAEMQAEAGGVGGSLKAGQGPEFAKRRKELDDFAKLKAITESQLKDRVAQLKDKRDRVAAAEAELAQIDGELGKLTGEMEVADKQIAVATVPKEGGSLAATKETMAVTGFSSLDDAFAQFRQRPERRSFDAIQQQCAALLAVFDKVPAIKAAAQVKNVRCDPSVVAEPVARILALNEGQLSFKERCAKPESLPQTTVDDLLTFGQQCVQTSGLAGQDTAFYRSQINSIGLNRDDKAHRFVVSWNAFLDGNRLAYLALGIAIALDGLVFMSGLFGANAVSSPLVRLPSAGGRSPGDLEARMYAALGNDIYGNARRVLNALHPIKARDGFVSEVRLAGQAPKYADEIRSVLSAAAELGAVRPDSREDGVYLVRGELSEFLSKACHRELRTNPNVKRQAELARESEIADHAEYEKKRHGEMEGERLRAAEAQQDERDLQRRARALEPVLKAALLPDRIEDREALFHQASQVLAHMRPTAGGKDGAEGFTSEIELGEREQNVLLLRSVLNAAATRKAVVKASQAAPELYLIQPEFTLCLTAIRVKAYEDWQQRANKPKMFPWLRSRDVTPANLTITPPAVPRNGAPSAGILSGRLPSAKPAIRSVPAPPSASSQEISAATASTVRAMFNGPAQTQVVDPETLDALNAWAKRNAFSDLELGTVHEFIKTDWSAQLSAYLGRILGTQRLADNASAAREQARSQLQSFLDSTPEGRVNDAETAIIARAFYDTYLLDSLNASLSVTIDGYASRKVPGSVNGEYYDSLCELKDAIGMLPEGADNTFRVWDRAIANLNRLDDTNSQHRVAV